MGFIKNNQFIEKAAIFCFGPCKNVQHDNEQSKGLFFLNKFITQVNNDYPPGAFFSAYFPLLIFSTPANYMYMEAG